MPDRLVSNGESQRARDAGLPTHRERLHEHEQAARRQAQTDGRERRPRTAQELDRIAQNTARRYDRKYGR